MLQKKPILNLYYVFILNMSQSLKPFHLSTLLIIKMSDASFMKTCSMQLLVTYQDTDKYSYNLHVTERKGRTIDPFSQGLTSPFPNLT